MKVILIGMLIMWLAIPAQAQNIRAGLIGGLNATQVDGDGIGGYEAE